MVRFKKYILNLYSTIFSWNKKKVVLIISSGRTGTNFMAHWFSQLSDEIYSIHEPSPDLFDLGIAKYRNNRKITNRVLRSERALQLYNLNKQGKNIYIESNPNLLLLMSDLKRLFKNLKVIFIKREFDSYLLSALNKSPDNSNINYFYADNDSRKRITAIDMDDKKFANKWNNFSKEERIAWWWKKSNDLIDEYSLSNNNSMIVKYEDLFDKENKSLLNEILRFSGLDNFELSQSDLDRFNTKLNTNQVKKFKDLNELDKGVFDKINSILK